MKYCPECGNENEEDAIFCKICGFRFIEIDENRKQPTNTKTKVKTKGGRTKVKRVGSKNKTKVKYEKSKPERRMSFFQKIMMFFFIVLCIGLLGVCGYMGYYIYNTNNIEVPSVVGYDYDDASRTLKDASLNVLKVETPVTSKDEVGIVLKQSKKSGSKVSERTVIKLTVGVLDNHVTVPKVEGMSLSEGLSLMNENHVKYKIIYETSDKDGIILKQSIAGGKKILNTDLVTLTVSKKDSDQKKDETPSKDENTQDNTKDDTNLDNKDNKDTNDTDSTLNS